MSNQNVAILVIIEAVAARSKGTPNAVNVVVKTVSIIPSIPGIAIGVI